MLIVEKWRILGARTRVNEKVKLMKFLATQHAVLLTALFRSNWDIGYGS